MSKLSLMEIITNRLKTKPPLVDPVSIRQDIEGKTTELIKILKGAGVSDVALSDLRHLLLRSICRDKTIAIGLRENLIQVTNELIAHKPLPEAIVILEEGLQDIGLPIKGISSYSGAIKEKIDLCEIFTEATKLAFEIKRN